MEYIFLYKSKKNALKFSKMTKIYKVGLVAYGDSQAWFYQLTCIIKYQEMDHKINACTYAYARIRVRDFPAKKKKHSHLIEEKRIKKK